jgi:hypothetical protein
MVLILVRGLCGCTTVPGAGIKTFSYGLRIMFGGRGLSESCPAVISMPLCWTGVEVAAIGE